MSLREIIYSTFYIICFVLALFAGLKGGFTGSHTPPGPFIVELIAVPIGGILCLIDIMRFRPVTSQNMRVHIWGLGANLFIMIFVLVLAFT